MKPYRFLFPILSAAFLAAGCKPSTNPGQAIEADTNSPARQKLDQMKTETKEAAQATRDYAYAQKEEFTQKVRAELAELNLKLDELSAKVENSSDTTKVEAKEKLAAMREKAAHLSEQLDQLKDTTANKWDETKAGIQKGWSDLKDSFDQGRQWLADKLAPTNSPAPNPPGN